MLSINFLMTRGLYIIMDNYIIVNINLFTHENKVFIAHDNGDVEELGLHSIEELPKSVIHYAYSKNIYKVKIVGGAKYSQLLEYGIGSIEIANYNERKIEIEVI